MEIQCKERVDILDALKKSRKEAEKVKKDNGKSSTSIAPPNRASIPPKSTASVTSNLPQTGRGEGTLPALTRNDLPPPLPQRPLLMQKDSDVPNERPNSTTQVATMATPPASYAPPTLPVPPQRTSRTPSPDKKGGRAMLTTLRGPKDAKGRPTKATKLSGSRPYPPQASSKAAGLAWDSTPRPSGQRVDQTPILGSTRDLPQREHLPSRTNSTSALDGFPTTFNDLVQPQSGTRTPPDLKSTHEPLGPRSFDAARKTTSKAATNGTLNSSPTTVPETIRSETQAPPKHKPSNETKSKAKAPVEYPSYRTEFPPTVPSSRATAEFNARIAVRDESPSAIKLPTRPKSPQRKTKRSVPNGISRRPVANASSPRLPRHDDDDDRSPTSESNDEIVPKGLDAVKVISQSSRRPDDAIPVDSVLGDDAEAPKTWEERVKWIRKHLPKGVDEIAAKQIFNEIVVRGDEVHWSDVAGLEAAKTALKEAVVYPFLRPDLFMGLREPARGMLLFGPPGTGKTMLARAVATESRSTFFAISASSLTSKWLGESEKLVRALFLLAKALAPSIIFVDEIDSLLSSRGGSSEHEATRRIKTEFLIQWSDLQRAAAGSKQSDKEKNEGDASRVLVLAATNMPWAIDEAARRRFVRRQYIPLPEAHVRAEQLRTLLGHQKHSLNRQDIQVLVELTDGMHLL